NLAARVNRLIPVGVMLELGRFQPMDRKVASELELLEQREHRLHRVCHWAETIEFEHRLSLDLVRCLAGGRSGSKADAAGSLADRSVRWYLSATRRLRNEAASRGSCHCPGWRGAPRTRRCCPPPRRPSVAGPSPHSRLSTLPPPP